MISFCITCKNRSKVQYKGKVLELFPNCLKSILVCCNNLTENVEVIISDWNSTDMPLEQWVPDLFKGSTITVKTVQVTDMEHFNLAHGRNIAYKASRGNKLFFIDADMILCKEVVLDVIQDINDGYIGFPICYFDGGNRPKKSRSGFGVTSYGNMFISRDKFESIGLWQGTSFYGSEDVTYYQILQGRHEKISRKEYRNFVHQWHPKYIGWAFGKKRNPKIRI